MFKLVVLHDRFSDNPIIVKVDTINIIMKCNEKNDEYTAIFVNGNIIEVKETIGNVLSKVKKEYEKDMLL